MKKLNFVISSFLLMSVSAFAFDVVPELDLSAKASFTFGWDIDAKATGISNDSSIDAKLNFVSKATEEKGDKDVVGWIQIKDFQILLNNKKNDDKKVDVTFDKVQAKVLLGPVYIDVTGASNKIDYVNIGLDYTPFVTNLGSNSAADAAIADPSEEFAGIEIGLDLDFGTIGVGVSSQFDWKEEDTADDADGALRKVEYKATDVPDAGVRLYDNKTTNPFVANGTDDVATLFAAGAAGAAAIAAFGDGADGAYAYASAGTADEADINKDNNYSVYLSFNLKAVENLTVATKVSFETANKIVGLGVKGGYKFDLGDNSLGFLAGVDFVTDTDDKNTVVQIGTGLGFQFAGDKLEKVKFFGWDKDKKWTIHPGVNVGFDLTSYTNKSVTMIAKTHTVKKGVLGNLLVTFYDANLIDKVDIIAFTLIESLLASDDFKNTFKVKPQVFYGARSSFDLGVLSPYVEFYGNPAVKANALDASNKLAVGTNIEVIDNTTFNIDYTSGNLSAKKAEAGVVSFTTTIKF